MVEKSLKIKSKNLNKKFCRKHWNSKLGIYKSALCIYAHCTYIYKFSLSFYLFVCVLSNKCKNGWTDQIQILCGTSGQSDFKYVSLKYVYLKLYDFVKFWKCAKKYYEIRKFLYCSKRRCSQIKPQLKVKNCRCSYLILWKYEMIIKALIWTHSIYIS